MLYRILRGPDYGKTIHLPQSQEINLSVRFGDLEPVEGQSPDTVTETANLSRQKLLHPVRGHKIIKRMDAEGRAHYNIVLDDGVGGRIVYEGIPPKRRVWRYDPQTEQEGYVFEDSGCPPELCRQWETLNREDVNHEVVSELKQQARNKLQVQMDEQNKLRGKLY